MAFQRSSEHSTGMLLREFLLQILKKEEAIPWPGTLAIVHSYIAYKEGRDILVYSCRNLYPKCKFRTKCIHLCYSTLNLWMFCPCPTAKEEEKQKLMKWSAELKLEREQLEQRVKQLSNSITVRCLFIFLFNWSFSGYKISYTIAPHLCEGMFASEKQL